MDEEPRDLAWEELNGSRRPPKHHLRLMRVLIPLFVFILLMVIAVLSWKSIRPGNPLEKLKAKQGAFSVSETYPRPFDSGVDVITQPVIVFSKPLDIEEKDLAQYISISPSVTGSWHIEKNGEAVYFSSGHTNVNGYAQELNYNTVYTLTVKKGLRSSSGDTLPKGTTVRFRTQMDLKANISADYKFLNAFPGKDIKVPLYRGSTQTLVGEKVHISIYPADTDQLLTYFTYTKDNWQLLYEYKKKAGQKAISTYDAAVETDQYTNRVTLPGISQNGLYYVTISNDYGTDDLFITVTNHINQVISDASSTRVWATDTEKGASKAGVKTSVYSLDGGVKLVHEGVTDQNGIVTFKKEDFDVVLTEANGSISLSYTNDYWPYMSTSDDYKTFLYGDRPVYRPGDTAHVKGVVRKRDKGTLSVPAMDVYMRLADSTYIAPEKATYTKLKVDKNGTFVNDIKIPESSLGYYPTISAYTKLKDGTYRLLSSMDLNVQSYTKPDIDISATASSGEYISKDTARVTVTAKSIYGQPIKHIPFTYRVLAESYAELKDRTAESIDQYSSYYGSGTELTSGSATFDDKGQAVIAFSTDLSSFEQSAVATIEVLPQMGASPSVGKIATLIHRGDYGIFFDTVKGNTTDGITGDILTMTHDRERKPAGGHDVEISLYRFDTYSEKTLVTKQTAAATPEGRMHIAFPGISGGTYELVAIGKDGRDNTITTRYNVYVGKDSRGTENPDSLRLKAESTQSIYSPGETATVQITANFPLTDVIVASSVDSGYPTKLSAFEVRKINDRSFVYTTTVGQQAANSSGVYVYTTYGGETYSDTATINVDLRDRVATSKITFDKNSYRPGDIVSALIETKDQSGKPISMDTSLSVMDAAVLRIGKINDSIDTAFYGDASYISSPTVYASTTGIYTNRGGGGGGGCFLEGTSILMADGTQKNIEDVRMGDTIKTLAGNGNTTLVQDSVTGTIRHIVNEYLTINGTLNVTSIHRIYLNNEWHTAGEAKPGDTLLTSEGKSVVIASIERHTGLFAVYNLSIKERHTYIAEGFYVHNDKGMVPRQNFVDTAYWNPHIQTNSNGTARVTFKLPDNVTTFTASLYGNSLDSRFTQTISEFVSKKDIVIIPAVPRFYYEHESSTVAAIVQNTTDKPVNLDASVIVKAAGVNAESSLTINAGDFAELAVPMQSPSATDKLTVDIKLKDKAGKPVDAVSLSLRVLPKGSLAATWESNKGSVTYDYKAEYPSVDANTVSFSVAPHYALRLTNKGYSGISSVSSYASSTNAISLYVTSYLTARAAEGTLDPATFEYAATRSELRNALNTILGKQLKNQYGKFSGWDTSSLYNGETDSPSLYYTYMAIALGEARADGVLGGISNAQELTDAAKSLATEWYTKNGTPSNEESIAHRWLTGFADARDCNSSLMTECYASRAIHGDKKALETLISLALPSADDRLIWDSTSSVSSGLAPLAVITYGTDEEADKALVGLTASRNTSYYTSDSSLYLLAAVKHAIRRNIDIASPKATVTVNGRTVFDWSTNVSPTYPITSYETTINNADMKDGKVTIELDQEEGIPLYSTFSTITYGEKQIRATEGKLLAATIKRRYRSLETGLETKAIPVGSSGIIEVSMQNPYLNIGDALKTVTYTALMADMQTPGYMYLNQYAENSPQYQSTLDTYYPGEQYSHSYSQPGWYSDTTVFFQNVTGNTALIMPYIIYNISAEKPYQPKTAIVFPITGAIAIEK